MQRQWQHQRDKLVIHSFHSVSIDLYLCWHILKGHVFPNVIFKLRHKYIPLNHLTLFQLLSFLQFKILFELLHIKPNIIIIHIQPSVLKLCKCQPKSIKMTAHLKVAKFDKLGTGQQDRECYEIDILPKYKSTPHHHK